LDYCLEGYAIPTLPLCPDPLSRDCRRFYRVEGLGPLWANTLDPRWAGWRGCRADRTGNVAATFAWVRLAQRIPVRIHIDRVAPGDKLVAGMTATVEIIRREHIKTGKVRLWEFRGIRVIESAATSDALTTDVLT
jgi:hypothetical protein